MLVNWSFSQTLSLIILNIINNHQNSAPIVDWVRLLLGRKSSRHDNVQQWRVARLQRRVEVIALFLSLLETFSLAFLETIFVACLNRGKQQLTGKARMSSYISSLNLSAESPQAYITIVLIGFAGE
jgi:hypothetical protein